jgi:hypothetical protein
MGVDKTARDVELAAYKRRLALLRERAVLQGMGRDSSIESEIEAIAKRIADLEGIGVRQIELLPEHTMNSEQYQHVLEMRSAYFKRLCVLELKEARLGVDTPAHILVDIEELRSKISELDLQVKNQGAISTIEGQRKGVY